MRKTFDTWSRESALVTWFFSVPGQAHEDTRANLERSTSAVLALVSPFGRVSDVDLARIGEAFSSQETIRRISVTLNLAVNDGTEIWLAGAGRIDLNRPDENEATASDIDIWISLDVDIYASVTFGRSRDNAQLARINGPRLTAFLQRFRDRLQARLEEMDAGSYKGQVNADGFM